MKTKQIVIYAAVALAVWWFLKNQTGAGGVVTGNIAG